MGDLQHLNHEVGDIANPALIFGNQMKAIAMVKRVLYKVMARGIGMSKTHSHFICTHIQQIVHVQDSYVNLSVAI